MDVSAQNPLVSWHADWLAIVIPNQVDVSKVQSVNVFKNCIEFRIRENEYEQKARCLIFLN
jgi:hypothetical protein